MDACGMLQHRQGCMSRHVLALRNKAHLSYFVVQLQDQVERLVCAPWIYFSVESSGCRATRCTTKEPPWPRLWSATGMKLSGLLMRALPPVCDIACVNFGGHFATKETVYQFRGSLKALCNDGHARGARSLKLRPYGTRRVSLRAHQQACTDGIQLRHTRS